MKAISVRQPWANMIMNGEKRYEYRSWSTDHRGDLLICSSGSPKFEGMLSGHALCIVNVTDVIKVTRANYRSLGQLVAPSYNEKLYAWKLEDVRVVKPFPIKGKLNFYYIDDELIKIERTVETEPINTVRKPRIYQPRNRRR